MSTELPTETIHIETAVLGGGMGGVYCVKSFLKSSGRDHGDQIALFSDQNYLVFQPMLPEVASSGLSPRHVIASLRQLCRGARVYRGEVEEIDPDRKIVFLRPGAFARKVEVHYERLVLALGASIDLSRVPGMPEHALLMQNVGDAMILRATIISRFEEANVETRPEIRQRLLTFVVVGGGYSGVETAGQILDMFESIHRFYTNVSGEDFHVVLVHSQAQLLPTLSKSLGEYTEKQLRQQGMDVRLQSRVRSVTANKVYIDGEDEPIETNTVVSTVGNAPHPIIRQLIDQHGFAHERGRLKTDDRMQVEGRPDLFAVGDCAAIPLPDGTVSPATAQFATRQGERLGKNLSLAARGQPTKPFAFKGLGELAAIGHQRAVASVMGWNFSGFFAWWMWRTIYLYKLPTFERKLRVMIDWTLELIFPRDINLLSPRYTRPLRQVHLEKGDILFHPGDPPFSLYVLKSGRIDLLDGDERVRCVNPGEFFGERALTHNQSYLYRAVAAEESILVSVGGEIFRQMVQDSVVLQRLFRKTSAQYLPQEEIDSFQQRIAPEKRGLTAGEVMNAKYVSISTEARLGEVLALIQEKSHHSFPVLTPRGELQGVLNREDFLDLLKVRDLDLDAPLSGVTLRQLPEVRTTDTVRAIVEAMVRNGAHKVLVLDEEGRLAGLVTTIDLLTAPSVVNSS